MSRWRLEAIFNTDKDLETTSTNVQNRIEEFYKNYSLKLEKLNNDEFLKALEEYEGIMQTLGDIMTYSFLKFATNSDEGVFYAKYQEFYTKVSEKTLFFELEFNRLEDKKQDEFIAHCKKYSYFLELLKKQKPHQLSDKEEKIMLKTSLLGSSAFSRLFDEHFSRLSFDFRGKSLSEEEVLSLLHDKDRSIRKDAAMSLAKGLKPHKELLAYILNMIKKDLKIKCDIRGYKSPEEPRHEDNQISQKSVDALVNTAQDEFGIVHEYYELKKELLGLDELYDYDRYAPLDAKEESYEFEKSKKIVLDAFGRFGPEFADIATKAFEDGWIDIYPKDKKRSGAFSHPSTSNSHPYVLLNHTDKRRDLFTLAHELGHAIHQYLSYDVGYLASDTPLTTAETASVFAEMLVFDSIKDGLSKEDKLSLIAGKLEDIFATLFRQINFTTFERRFHGFNGELNVDEIGDIWLEENEKMFGSSVKLSEEYKLLWSYIPHFVHSPFYCYAYSYGQLLVLALYGLYKSGECKDFVKIYTKFLASGGSKSPKELVSAFGFDIEDEKFWRIGMGEVKRLFDEFKGAVDGR